MRRGTLDTAASGGDKAFACGGVQATGELLFLRFDTGDDRDGEELLIYLLVGLRLGEEGGVALLPKELAGTQERLCKSLSALKVQCFPTTLLTGVLELPPNHAIPLVELQRQVAMALDPLGVV
jgi:hypothetical protein